MLGRESYDEAVVSFKVTFEGVIQVMWISERYLINRLMQNVLYSPRSNPLCENLIFAVPIFDKFALPLEFSLN